MAVGGKKKALHKVIYLRICITLIKAPTACFSITIMVFYANDNQINMSKIPAKLHFVLQLKLQQHNYFCLFVILFLKKNTLNITRK